MDFLFLTFLTTLAIRNITAIHHKWSDVTQVPWVNVREGACAPRTCPFSLTPSIAQTSFDLDPMGDESGGQRGRVPKVTNLGGDVLSRIENEVSQIRGLFRFLGYSGCRLATCRRFVPHSKIRATPLLSTKFGALVHMQDYPNMYN